MLQLEKSPCSNEDPEQPKIDKQIFKSTGIQDLSKLPHAPHYTVKLRFKLKWSYTTACTLKPKALLLGGGSWRFIKSMAFTALGAATKDPRVPGAQGTLTVHRLFFEFLQ